MVRKFIDSLPEDKDHREAVRIVYSSLKGRYKDLPDEELYKYANASVYLFYNTPSPVITGISLMVGD